MTVSLGLSGELSELGQAIGLVDSAGNFDASWFSEPIMRLAETLKAPAQRSALLRFLDAILPPENEPGRPAGEKWHPLLGQQSNGNLYLTAFDTGSGVMLGVGVDFHAGAGAAVNGRIRAQMNVIRADSSLTFVAGTNSDPIVVELRVDTNWPYDPGGGHPIGLHAIVARAHIVPDPDHPSFSLEVVLEGLSLGGEAPTDKQLNVADLGREVPDLLAGLLKVVLAEVGPDPTVTLLANHLLGLLGLADADDIPAFPFAQLGEGPVSLQHWLATLIGDVEGTPATAGAWLQHFAGLLGQVGAFTGNGTLDTPWQVRLITIAGVGELFATLAKIDGHLQVGLGGSIGASLGAGQPHLSGEFVAAIADIPLGGTSSARVLPRADIRIRITGDAGQALVDDPTVRIGTALTGARWNGSVLAPIVELLDCRLDTTPYARLDLTNVDSVASVATDFVVTAIDHALGLDVGRRIAALVGLVVPEDPAHPGNPLAGWTHHLDLTMFVVDPARAIGAYHRGVLTDGTSWSLMLRELSHLVGLGASVLGSGTEVDPWSVTIASPSAGLSLALVAWNAQTGGAAVPQQLRIGLRFVAQPGPASATWTGEILAFDLPSTGSGAVSFVGAQVLRLTMAPVIDTSNGHLDIRLADLDASVVWQPGSALTWQIRAQGLELSAEGDSISINELHLPPAGVFDIHDLGAAAASLGLGIGDLEHALRFVVSLFAQLTGPEEQVAAGLFGLHRRLGGLSEDSPTIVDLARPGLLLHDPLGAVRGWIARVLGHVGSTGQITAQVLLGWLEALGAGEVPGLGALVSVAPPVDLLKGAGTFAEPWRLHWPGDASKEGPELDLWLEPAGPPAQWLTALVGRAQSATDFDELTDVIVTLSWYDPDLRSMVAGLLTRDLLERLRAFETYVSSGDGVVSRESQGPDIFGWVQGTDVDAPHTLIPSHPDAITQILYQIESLFAGGAPRVVLLIGPTYTDFHAWDALLASPARVGVTDPAASFDLRSAGIDPLTISLDNVTAVADYYVADLADDRRGDASYMATQIERIVSRLNVLHPGQVVIVAHSYAAIAARRFAALNPDRVRGLITVGAPHLGSPLPFLGDPEIGDAVRIASTFRSSMAASTLRDVLDHLVDAMEGYQAPSVGALAAPRPYPAASFGMAAQFDLGTIPVFCVSALLSADVFEWLRDAVVARAQALSALPRTAPTHLAYGIAMPVNLGLAGTGETTASALTRIGLGQIPLSDGVAPTARAAHHLRVELNLAQPNGWLVGGPGASDVDGRLRRLQLGVTFDKGTSGVRGALDATLQQAAWRGVTAPIAGLDHAVAGPVLGAAFANALATDTETTASVLTDALTAIDLVCTDASGIVSLANDALAALRTDPVAYLRTRVPAALSRTSGWAGLSALDPATPEAYSFAAPGSQFALFARRLAADGTWKVGIETGTDVGEPSDLGINLDVDIDLPAFESSVELTIHVGPLSLLYRAADGTILASASPWIDDIILWPTPTLDDLAARFNDALPRLLMSGALAASLSEFVPGIRFSLLESLMRAPGEFLSGPEALGHPDGGIDVAKVSRLLSIINEGAGLPAGPGLQLPGDVSIIAGAGDRPNTTRLSVATSAPIGGVLELGFSIDIDALRHVTPAGTVSVNTPLTGTWPHVTITFGVSASGVTLAVTPQGLAPITILPTFSGLGALRGAAEALLPSVLDAGVATFTAPHPAWLEHLLTAAGHIGIYNAGGGFAAHAAELTAMLESTWFATFDPGKRANVASAVVDLLTLIPGLPGTLTSSGGLVQWSHSLPAAAGSFAVGVGWGASGPTAQFDVTDLKPGDAPLDLSSSLSVDDTGIDVTLAIGVDLSSIGVALAPRVLVELTPEGRFRVRFAPLSSGTDDGPLVVNLAPTVSVDAGAGTPELVLTGWALPLAIRVGVIAADSMMPSRLWSNGPTLSEALTNAGILAAGKVAHPLPNIWQMLTGFLAEAASVLDLPIGDLHLRLVDEANRIGVRLSGKQDIPLGDLDLSVLFGAPASWGSAATEGLEIFLLETKSSGIDFNLSIDLHGVGVGLSKSDGTALISESALRLNGLNVYVFMDIETQPSFDVIHGGAGIELAGFGLPLDAALGAGGGSNPVASNLLSSGGSGGSGSAHGDSRAVNPKSDLDVWYWDHPANTGGPLRVLIGGQTGIFWIPVHAGFGPIFIGELGLGVTNTVASLVIDGGVSVAGLSAEVDQLSISVPYALVSDPSQWTIDLKGLAVGYSGPAITIAGGLVKFDGPPIEYDGMLLVQIASIGAIVVGAYSVVGSSSDEYTSFAIFGGVFVPIGLPPIINLTGIALGLGYNRRLLLSEDLTQIPDFMLVKALDRPEALANNPMQALYSFLEQVPPARGALWFAAGLRGTSFEIVHITAVLYVALDRGVEIGLLGVARMALPADDAAIVSIELALKVRFSSEEGLFSVQAQLTDNSWLISHDCQLTGGFAFFMWFKKSQFLLTMGGYHPAFKPLPEYPVVPRLGYRWNFLGVVQIKGESYFALTSTTVMAGMRMEAAYGPDWLQLWFTAYADILVSWDPFHYEVDVGVAVGARLRIEVCFLACATIEISVSVGADLHLAGPPFHGTVTVDLCVTSVTVPFGDDARLPPPAKHWDEFVLGYLKSGDANAVAVNAQVTAGLLPAEPAGAPVAPGTEAQPWRLSAEWSFQTETRMPARGFAFQSDDVVPEAQMDAVIFGRFDNLAKTYAFDLAPMYVNSGALTARHRLVLSRRTAGGAFVDLVPRAVGGADHSLLLDETLFRVTPMIGQVSEATYHFFPDFKPPAAANTLPVLTGVTIVGVAGLHNESSAIPIGKLVDATDFRPLPFARRSASSIAEIIKAGKGCVELSNLANGLDSRRIVSLCASVLTGTDGPFGQARATSGLTAQGYGPVAVLALTSRRSAPAVLSALSEGLTLKPVDRGVPAPVANRGAVAGVPLKAPRLRALLQRTARPSGVVVAMHTTAPAKLGSKTARAAANVPVVRVTRDLVTEYAIPSAALHLYDGADAPRTTRATRPVTTMRNTSMGALVGRRTITAMTALEDQILGNGVTLRAGVTHLWELPGGTEGQITLRGEAAVRITELSSSGTVLHDTELGRAGATTLPLVEGCAMLAVTALGRLDAANEQFGLLSGRGAVALAAAPAPHMPVAGWQIGDYAVQVGPTTLLARGAVLSLSKPFGANVRRHVGTAGLVPLSLAMLEQEVVETALPAAVSLIGVLIDAERDGVASPDSVVVHSAGAILSETPLHIRAGQRSLFLYEIVPAQASAPIEAITITVGVASKLSLAGVIGTHGQAADWAHALASTPLAQLVGSEQLSIDGAVNVQLTIKNRQEALND